MNPEFRDEDIIPFPLNKEQWKQILMVTKNSTGMELAKEHNKEAAKND